MNKLAKNMKTQVEGLYKNSGAKSTPSNASKPPDEATIMPTCDIPNTKRNNENDTHHFGGQLMKHRLRCRQHHREHQAHDDSVGCHFCAEEGHKKK